jgi:hypothetical protein
MGWVAMILTPVSDDITTRLVNMPATPTEPPDDLLATFTDRQGRTVTITTDRLTHACAGHPEVRIEYIKRAVETAEERTMGNRPDTEKLWARNIGPAKWFSVVVRYESRSGVVITAMATTKGPKSGDLI